MALRKWVPALAGGARNTLSVTVRPLARAARRPYLYYRKGKDETLSAMADCRPCVLTQKRKGKKSMTCGCGTTTNKRYKSMRVAGCITRLAPPLKPPVRRLTRAIILLLFISAAKAPRLGPSRPKTTQNRK